MNKTTSLDHFNKFKDLAKEAGLSYVNIQYVFGYDKSYFLRKFEADHNLNNIPLSFWDSLGISATVYNPRLRSLSLCEKVCLFKHLVIYQMLEVTPIFE